MTARSKPPPISEEELVIGLVYGAGTAVDPVLRLLRNRLQPYGYGVRSIHLSSYFPIILGRDFDRQRPDNTSTLQSMGDELRAETEAPELLADLTAYLVQAIRSRENIQRRTAWVVQSFKRPEEVARLREIYGPRFILLGIHVPQAVRTRTAAKRMQRWAPITTRRYVEEAAKDLHRDAHDPEVKYGQELQDTFAKADFFLDARTDARLKDTLPRIVRLLFEEPFEPPFRDEQAMYHAFTAGLRSAEMGRQVGAAIATPSGDVIAVGTNEVPSGNGGLYWSPDQPDGRDFAQQPAVDSNAVWQRRIARELVLRMAKQGWIAGGRVEEGKRGHFLDEPQLDAFLEAVQGTRFSDITEFGRAVHAEMDALTTAARRGVAVEGCTIACTTTPCHGCTRHLIAAGIRRVVFIHPYAKSLAHDLHEDAIALDPEGLGFVEGKVRFDQYVGVAPRVYPQYFDFGQVQRKDKRGEAARSEDPATAKPRVLRNHGTFTFGGPAVPPDLVRKLEQEAADRLRKRLREAGLKPPRPQEEEDV